MIGIIIPVYDEGLNIGQTLDEINKKIRTPHQIYIIYDKDDDNTLPVIQKREQSNISLLKNKFGQGVLNAIKTGLFNVNCEALLVVMADLSDDLSAVDSMYEIFEQGYDIICGSRYMKGGKQIGGPWLKKTMSRLAGISLRLLINLPTHDITNSFKLYRSSLIKMIHIESSGGFEIGMEIVVKAYLAGYKIGEVPTIWLDRTKGKSRFRLWLWLPKYLKWYWYAISRKSFNKGFKA